MKNRCLTYISLCLANDTRYGQSYNGRRIEFCLCSDLEWPL